MNSVWLNGELIAASAARIDPADRGFTLGDGVFETMRAEAGAVRHGGLHLARLRQGAGVLGIGVPWSDGEITAALTAVAGGAACALRLTLTRGPMARGVLPQGAPGAETMLITAGALPPPLPPARVIVAGCTRRNEWSPLSRVKSLNYGDGILARREAAAAGFDDALLLNTQGDLAEATAASVVLVLDGAAVTPRVEDGALPGIARGLLLHAGLVLERRLTMQEVARAEAGVLVNALGVRAIGAIGGRALGDPAALLTAVARCSATGR